MLKENRTFPETLALALKGALLLILASQIGISLFQGGFVVSAAIMLLPLYVFLKPNYPVFLTALFAGPGVFLLRSLLQAALTGSFQGMVSAYAPEILFFLCYGLLLSLYLRFAPLRPFHVLSMLPLVVIDFLSNLCELVVRMGSHAFSAAVILGILGAAVGRTFLTAALLWTLDSYGVALTRKEDSERYRRLVLMTSSLKGELVWLKKNANLIEGTMSEAYSLYDMLCQQERQDDAAQKALTVAKDIHDVKKEYLLIIRGIDEALGEEREEDGMYLQDIWQVLKPAIERLAKEQGKTAVLQFPDEDSLYTRHHYTLMAIFQNLLSNAVEAASPGSTVHMDVHLESRDGHLLFTVQDDAGGIAPQTLSKIFKPGFSTKINTETGAVNRGLGLALVRDLVQENLGGSIEAQSRDEQTKFTLEVPKERLVNG